MQAFLITFKLAIITVIILLIIGIPLAWRIYKMKAWPKAICESLVTLPLILPPTVLGFYLLLLLSPNSFFGSFIINVFGTTPVFHFSGLVIGSVIFSLPFAVRPILLAFEQNGSQPALTASTLGIPPKQQFFKIHLPMISNALFTAAILVFAHTLGEFGVVLMIGGNIPGETQTIAIAIYDSVEQLAYQQAHQLSISLLLIAFIILLSVFVINKKQKSMVL